MCSRRGDGESVHCKWDQTKATLVQPNSIFICVFLQWQAIFSLEREFCSQFCSNSSTVSLHPPNPKFHTTNYKNVLWPPHKHGFLYGFLLPHLPWCKLFQQWKGKSERRRENSWEKKIKWGKRREKYQVCLLGMVKEKKFAEKLKAGDWPSER